MDRIRNFLGGVSNDTKIGNSHNQESNDSKLTQGNSSSKPYIYQKHFNERARRELHDDLYLSDDDDWGMSAFSATQSSLSRPNAYVDHRSGMDSYEQQNVSGTRSQKIFWDQSSIDSDKIEQYHMDLSRGAGKTSRGGFHEWERESLQRDPLGETFPKEDEDYNTLDRRSLEENNKAHQEVQEDIRSLEEDEEEVSAEVEDSGDKDEVINAYRDYLKSIREGGFETYLNYEDDETPNFSNMAFGQDEEMNAPYKQSSSDNREEKLMDIEEDRSLYGDLYKVRDVRAQISPDETWRAKAKALVDYDNKRMKGKTISSLRRSGLERLQKKVAQRMDGDALGGDNDFEDDMISYGTYRYKLASLYNPKFKIICMSIILMLAVAVGVWTSLDSQGHDESSQLAIPPKNNEVSQQSKPNEAHSPPTTVDAVANSMKAFDPKWYGRRSGWEGITFTDAVNFCTSHEKRVPCSYELYCNEGPGRPPYEGVKANGEQWAAISNGPNQWVMVGMLNHNSSSTCKTYKQFYNEQPKWGITGVSTEHEHGAGGITQNVMCCKDVNHLGISSDWWKEDTIDSSEDNKGSDVTVPTSPESEHTADESNDPKDGNVAVISNNTKIQEREKAVVAAFQPIWFSSSHGWSGTTYESAIEFCDSYNHMVICPFSAYCPNGNGKPSLPGSMVLDLDGEEWAPVNGPANTWVQIGKVDGDEQTTCTLHHDLLGERPQWGIDGSRLDIKHHIMCCLM